MTVILVVDDEDLIREFLSVVLKRAGYRVFLAANGREAAQLFEMHRPDIVISDMVMPEAEGFETMRALRSIDPDVRIVAMSGQMGSLDYLRMAESLGACRSLRKPFRPQELLAVLDECMADDAEPCLAAPASTPRSAASLGSN